MHVKNSTLVLQTAVLNNVAFGFPLKISTLLEEVELSKEVFKRFFICKCRHRKHLK